MHAAVDKWGRRNNSTVMARNWVRFLFHDDIASYFQRRGVTLATVESCQDGAKATLEISPTFFLRRIRCLSRPVYPVLLDTNIMKAAELST
jgi:hypothetical protein